MKKAVLGLLSFLTVTFSLASLTACESKEYTECKNRANALWDNTKGGDPHKNDAYWAAIKHCKEKYDN
ncbi:hypothetical protein [Hydrogenovibrio marinus]|uniref:Lipoprotein n=1 Tax=Hydrogenovibrio marinus TaxID=28885 RepID=A0A066ZY34_HYDMR|nr:hypothetical protein [Hydrogenovibrio marinus]KDN95035.1 hypothetical protein EI16_01610 [Hydrogenovibrio marinus]BBN59501.1 hypothetical protein HVMH_1095 [Hydrogenovibrio marinus]